MPSLKFTPCACTVREPRFSSVPFVHTTGELLPPMVAVAPSMTRNVPPRCVPPDHASVPSTFTSLVPPSEPPVRFSAFTETGDVGTTAPLPMFATSSTPGTPFGVQFAGLNQSVAAVPTHVYVVEAPATGPNSEVEPPVVGVAVAENTEFPGSEIV